MRDKVFKVPRSCLGCIYDEFIGFVDSCHNFISVCNKLFNKLTFQAGKLCTTKLFDKSFTEADDAAKREFKNLKTLRHEKIVSFNRKGIEIFRPYPEVILHHFCQINLVDGFETSKMLLLKFDTLPGTDVITYLAEKSTYSEQMVADIATQVWNQLNIRCYLCRLFPDSQYEQTLFDLRYGLALTQGFIIHHKCK